MFFWSSIHDPPTADGKLFDIGDIFAFISLDREVGTCFQFSSSSDLARHQWIPTASLWRTWIYSEDYMALDEDAAKEVYLNL